MKPSPYDEPFNAALDSLKEAGARLDLTGLEHEVWSEIAIRQTESPGWFSLPAPALAACCVFAIAVGSLFGLTRAQAYEEKTSLAVEQSYVESIHPVLMSADHTGHHH